MLYFCRIWLPKNLTVWLLGVYGKYKLVKHEKTNRNNKYYRTANTENTVKIYKNLQNIEPGLFDKYSVDDMSVFPATVSHFINRMGW